jgi:hypothetical protein
MRSPWRWFLWVLLAAACDARGRAPVSDPVAVSGLMDTAAQLSARAPALASRFGPQASGWVEAEGGLVSAAGARLRARAPATAAQAWEVSLGGDAALGVALTPEGAAARPVQTRGGKAGYLAVWPATDAVLVADGNASEVAFVLHDATAPTTFHWQVALGAGLPQAKAKQSGLEFVDAQGAAKLWIPPPLAVDAAGTQRQATLSWEPERSRLTLALDTRGLQFPVLLDPTIEAVAWSTFPQGPGPGPGAGARAYQAMATVGSGFVFFGGTRGSFAYGDTWTFDGFSWAPHGPAHSPPARGEHAMGTLGNQAVLFGGLDSNTSRLGDTWTWDGNDWTQQFPLGSPSPRQAPAMVTFGGQVLLFGGLGGQGDYNDTWLWDGTNWTQQFPAHSPPPRAFHSMATLGSQVMLFGGLDSNGLSLGDTWTWDGTDWTQQFPAHSPSVRFQAPVATLGNQAVLFGGFDLLVGSFDDMWVWDGADWTQLAPARLPPGAMGMSMVALGSQLFLYNANVLWVWDGAWRRADELPTGRSGAGLATLVDVPVMFGGARGNGNELAETWTWHQTYWRPESPAHGPPRAKSPRWRPRAVRSCSLAGSPPFPSRTWETPGPGMAPTGPSGSPPTAPALARPPRRRWATRWSSLAAGTAATPSGTPGSGMATTGPT